MSELFSSNEQLFLNAVDKLKAKVESSSYQTKGTVHQAPPRREAGGRDH